MIIINYAIFRSEPIYTLNDLAQIGSHNKREKKAYNSNQNIKLELTKDNIEIVPLKEKYVKGFHILVKDYEKEHNERMKTEREDRKRTFNQMLNKSKNVVAAELLFTATHQFFNNMSKEEIKEWADNCMEFVYEDLGYTKEQVLHATVHLDEETPHLHCVVIPLIKKFDKRTNKYTLITSYPVTAISWGSSDCIKNQTCNTLEKSYVGAWLNNVFVASLPREVQFKLENMPYTRKVYNGDSAVDEEISNVKVRLLTESEYITYGGTNNYLDIKDWFWFSDIYNLYNVCSVDDDGSLSGNSPPYANGVRPVVEISDITITEGNGTLSASYIGNTSKATNVSNIAVGEYISIPKSDKSTYLARVIKDDQNGTKVVLNGLYAISPFGSNTTFSISSTIYTNALTNFKNSLDSNYFDNTNRNFNMTMYGAGANYANTTTMFNGNIGLPSVGEMFSGNDIDMSYTGTNFKIFVDIDKIENPKMNSWYWLMNAYSSANTRIMFYRGDLNNFISTDSNGVRPTWYVKNVKITGGSGTANDPYTLK